MPKLLAALAHVLTTHWKRSALGALAAFAVIAALGLTAGGTYKDAFSIPGAESQSALDLLSQRFPSASGDTATVVFSAKDGTLRDAEQAAALSGAVKKIAGQPHVSAAIDPLSAQGRGQVSKDGRIAFVTVQYDTTAVKVEGALERLESVTQDADRAGVQVAMRGAVVDAQAKQAAPVGEVIGVLVAVLLLTLLFRSLAAMAVTLVGALVGVGFGFLALKLLSSAITLPSVAPTIGLMLGLGAGIDYALLIVGRYREQRALGDSPAQAASTANGTAGMSVLAAGAIVVVAIAGLMTAGIPFVGQMGIGAAVVVAAVVLSALTILPIALGAMGKRLAPKKPEHVAPSQAFARWGELVTGHPVVATVAGLAVLAALALPALGMQLGQPDDGNKSADVTQRIAYDKLSEGFGPGFNGPLLLAVALPSDTTAATAGLQRVRAAVAATPGVVAVAAPVRSPEGDAAILNVTPASSPQDDRTSALTATLRDDVIPAAVGNSGLKVYVGGATATFNDMSDKIASRLFLFIGAVVLLSMLLLMAAFRSVWVPLVSALFNVLGIAAAYGALTAVFNNGWGMELLGLHETVPIVSFVPLFMFAIVFGLSMDYNVFLLSRIREAYQAGDSPQESVVHGLSRIAKVILVAGAIMASVFAGFVLGDDAIIKQMGFGLAVAVAIDVLVLRMLIAPAVVMLLGDHAWTLPRWLDRLLPNINLDGEHTPARREAPAVHPQPVTEGA